MNISRIFNSNLQSISLGLILAILTVLLGQVMGIVFGLNEDAIKDRLESSASQVQDTVYKGDEAAVKAVLTKSWNYMIRAHLHAGAMGTTAVVLIILVALLEAPRIVAILISVGLGWGGFGYSVFWMWAGFRAPMLGSTGLAKESLKWLAMPSSGIFVLSTLAVLVLLIMRVINRPKHKILG